MRNNDNINPKMIVWDWEDLSNANAMSAKIAKEFTSTKEEQITLNDILNTLVRKAKKEAFELMAQKAQNEANWQ